MPEYIGFSTINAYQPRTINTSQGVAGGVGNVVSTIVPGKKFKLIDRDLVVQDFINALNIPQGQKVGQPEYGTTLWTFVFEPATADVQLKLENEIKRVARLDPRMILNSVIAYPQENGILIEVEVAIVPFNNPEVINIYFNNLNNKAELR